MIIVLKNANAAANNLGKISITDKISDKVNSILKLYSKEFTLNQKLLFQDYYNFLTESGILSKTKMLLLPCLASDNLPKEAFTNIVSNNYVVNNEYADSTYWGISDGMIYSKGSQNAGYQIPAFNFTDANLITGNIFFGAYLGKKVANSNVLFFGKETFKTSLEITVPTTGINATLKTADNAQTTFTFENVEEIGVGLFGASKHGTDKAHLIYNGSSIVEDKYDTGNTPIVGYTSLAHSGVDNGTSQALSPIAKMLIISEYLSDQEMLELNNATEDLVNGLLI